MNKRKTIRRLVVALGFVIALVLLPLTLTPASLPDAASSGPSIKIYGANVWGVRGYFAIHTWVATRTEYEAHYRIDQIIGWRLRRNGTALVSHRGQANSPWFGNPAILLHEVKGEQAKAMIPRVRQAIKDYPYAEQYTMFPGPNSNSFTEWVALEVPELELDLPAKAIGRLWMRYDYEAD